MTGILSLMLVFGLVLIGCGDSNNPGDGNTLPAPIGENELRGKTYFEWESKIVFSAPAEGAEAGTYTAFDTGHSGTFLGADGNYHYIEYETGEYSWDGDTKTVTLKPEKVGEWKNGSDTYTLLTISEYRAAEEAMINRYREEMTEAEFNAELQKQGFSSVNAFLDYMVNREFSLRTYDYSFSGDSKGLFLEEALPAHKGSNELAGGTYNGMIYNNDTHQYEKDTRVVYTFAGDGTYTLVESYYTPPLTTTGRYSVDSTAKLVYLKPTSVNGKTRPQYYEDVNPGNHNYVDDDVCRAGYTNGHFMVEETEYDTVGKTIGWRQ
jgi:hypothetical protein